MRKFKFSNRNITPILLLPPTSFWRSVCKRQIAIYITYLRHTAMKSQQRQTVPVHIRFKHCILMLHMMNVRQKEKKTNFKLFIFFCTLLVPSQVWNISHFAWRKQCAWLPFVSSSAVIYRYCICTRKFFFRGWNDINSRGAYNITSANNKKGALTNKLLLILNILHGFFFASKSGYEC